jgi:predicted Zn-dependent protease
MFGFFKKIFGFFSQEKEEIDPDEIAEESWTADFSSKKPELFRFSITSEKSHIANAVTPGESAALSLSLLKSNCIAWTEDAVYRYRDAVLKARIRVDPKGGYAAAGLLFRMVDDRTYYMALVSNRGYFRLDLVRNGTPLALAGWTEAPGFNEPPDIGDSAGAGNGAASGGAVEFDLEIVAFGAHLVLLVNGEWAAECNDPSLSEGRVAFCAASYESAATEGEAAATALLLSFSLESRFDEVSKRYDQTEELSSPGNRLRLAETFAALGQANPALVQIRKAWEAGGARDPHTLQTAAKLAMALELWDEAAGYIEEGVALAKPSYNAAFKRQKADLLYARGEYEELLELTSGDEALSGLRGHAAFNLGAYAEAAAAYDAAFKKEDDGVLQKAFAAKNAASSYELLNEKEKALSRYKEAGRLFLENSAYGELGLIVSKLKLLGAQDWEALALCGKWAFGIENWAEADADLGRAEELRAAVEGKKPKADPAVLYLLALLQIRKGKRRDALPLLEKAVKLAPGYPLFRFRLAENRYLLDNDPADADLQADLEAALKVKIDEGQTYGWIHNFAAQLALNQGDAEKAASHLEKAAKVLGEVPAVRANRALSLCLRGDAEKALALLQSSRADEDPEGLMANCAGNILVREKRFEEADNYYRKALAADPANAQYRYNRASCLTELARYGEADDVITAYPGEQTPAMLELIAFIAAQKGEYRRAEAASRAALDADPEHAPSLLHLGWNCAAGGRWKEVEGILAKLDKLELNEEMLKGRNELASWMEDALTKIIPCGICGREWRVKRESEPVPALRLYAMPPDDMPAGTCPGCGKSYCVGCRKEALDEGGRFVCPDCGKPLKLSNDGLKKIVFDWASLNVTPMSKPEAEPTP